jgi:FRG domain
MESRLLREFDNRSRTIQEAAASRNPWEILFLMQHHKVPTRLLDWSRNLLIACFFAVHDEAAWKDDQDPPCVFVFNPHDWNKNVLGTAGVAGSMGPVTDLSGGAMTGYEPRKSGNPVGPLQADAVAIAGPEFASRIVAQRGAFTVFGTKSPEAARPLEEQDDNSAGGPTLARIVLRGDESAWKRALSLVGIGAFSAFPDLDGLATELRNIHLEIQ